MITGQESFPVCLDYKLSRKYAMFFIDMTNDILQSRPGDDAGVDFFIQNNETLQSRFNTLQSEFTRFIALVKESPHINLGMKEKIYSINLRARGNPRVNLLQRISLLFFGSRFNRRSEAEFVDVKSAIRSDVLTEFKDRMMEIAVEINLKYS